MDSTATAPARREIARLPYDLMSATLARTGPRDACRAAAVLPDFRAAADADAFWSSLLPRNLHQLADGELPAGPQYTKKQLFMDISDSARAVLLTDGLTSMWLDRATGAKCYMLSARKLGVAWGDSPLCWRWIPITTSRIWYSLVSRIQEYLLTNCVRSWNNTMCLQCQLVQKVLSHVFQKAVEELLKGSVESEHLTNGTTRSSYGH